MPRLRAIKESKDIDKIPLTELVRNLQTYELRLIRIGKMGKGKSMALKAKSSEIDESSDDEDFKMKSYITRQFKKFMKNDNGNGFDKDRRHPVLLSSRSKTKGRRMQGMAVSTLFPQDLSALGVKTSVT